jgi:hypothetical protein
LTVSFAAPPLNSLGIRYNLTCCECVLGNVSQMKLRLGEMLDEVEIQSSPRHFF